MLRKNLNRTFSDGKQAFWIVSGYPEILLWKGCGSYMAKILEVSLDWLVGNTDAELDTATLNRVQDISKLSQKDKELVFEFLDSFISNRKIKKMCCSKFKFLFLFLLLPF